MLFGLFFGVVAFLWRSFAGDVGLNCVGTAAPAFSVVFLAEYCTSLTKLMLICGLQNNSHYNLSVRVAWACLFCTRAAASHNLSLCHSQSRVAEKIQQAMEVQEKVIGSQKRVGKISKV